MDGILFEVVIILILLVANGVFSMSELAIVSARRARLQKRAEQGDTASAQALRLAAEPNDFLATVQVGITLVGILAGAFGGATIAEKITPQLQQISALAPYAKNLAFALVVIIITYLSLVIGELVPKQLALNHAEAIARRVAAPMKWLSRMAAPLVHLLSGSTNLLLRLLGVKASDDPDITEEEIRLMLRQGAQSGTVVEAERQLVENVFHLGDRHIQTIMTPRVDIIWLDINDSPAEWQQTLRTNRCSRYLVGDASVDEVIGFVRAKDLLAETLAGRAPDLRAILRPAHFIPESTLAWQALEFFKKNGSHLAVVVDEHGGTQGLITHHDLLEAIVGEIEAPANEAERSVIQRADGSWLFDGALSMHELKATLKLKELPGEDEHAYNTVSGFVMHQLGRVPAPADHFRWARWRFEVLDMDGRRIDKVLVQQIEPSSTDE